MTRAKLITSQPLGGQAGKVNLTIRSFCEPGEHFLATLGHRGAVALFVAADIGLDPLDLLLLALGDVLLRFIAARTLGAIRRVVAWREGLDAALAQVEDTLDDRI